MKQKLTVKELLSGKGQKRLTQVYVRSPEEAAACEAAAIDMLVACGSRWDMDGNRIRAIRDAAPNTFLTVPISLFGAASETEAIRLGLENMRIGADTVYTAISRERVRAKARDNPISGSRGPVRL